MRKKMPLCAKLRVLCGSAREKTTDFLCGFEKSSYICSENIKKENDMEVKKTKEQALNFIKAAVQHKQEWKKELEAEFKDKDVNVVFL